MPHPWYLTCLVPTLEGRGAGELVVRCEHLTPSVAMVKGGDP